MKRIDWTSPKALFALLILLGVILPAFPFMRYEDSFSRGWPFIFFTKGETVMKAIAIYLGIGILFFIAHDRAVKTVKVRPLYALDDTKFFQWAVILLAVSLLTFGLILYLVGGVSGLLAGASDRTRQFAGIQGLFILLNILSALNVVWFVRLTRRKTTSAEKVIFVLIALLSLAILSLQGQKSTLFILIATWAVIFNLRVRRFLLMEILAGAAALFVLLMAYHIYKQEYLVLGRVVSLQSGDRFWTSVYAFLNDQFFGNFMQLQTMCVLIEGMPIPLGFQYGYTYVAGALLLLPKALFPDKPLPSTGIFTQAFWPSAWRDYGTTLPPGIFGEGYLNFGIFGALGLGYLAGMIMGRLRGRVLNDPDDDLAVIDYAVAVAAMLHFFRGEFATPLFIVLSIILPCRLFMRRDHRVLLPAPEHATARG